ncbi:MAG: hypothetical protein JWR24_2505 [Actinoallomurus sp.]|nr:hypothetical protein [Actinoallomurus sp.]
MTPSAQPPGNANGNAAIPWANWPAVDPGAGTRVHRDELKKIANRLEAHLEHLLGTVSNHLETASSARAAAYGTWDAAGQLYTSVTTSHGSLSDHHTRYLHALMDVIKKLRQTAHVYDEAEAALEAQIRQVERILSSGDTADPADGPRPTRQTRTNSAT